jgi:hypothetical protein
MASATRRRAAAAAAPDDAAASAAAHRAAAGVVERKRARDAGAAAAAADDVPGTATRSAKRARSAASSLSLQPDDFDDRKEEKKDDDDDEEKDEGHAASELSFDWDMAGLLDDDDDDEKKRPIEEDSSSDDDAEVDEKERKGGEDTKEKKKGEGKGKKQRKGSSPPSHPHELQWFTHVEVYSCHFCGRSKEEMWMCTAAVEPECQYAECLECCRKREKRERIDPDTAVARWSRKLKPVLPLPFTGPAFALPAHCATSPLGLFHRFVTLDVIDRMVVATNRYAARAERQSKVYCLFHSISSCIFILLCTTSIVWCALLRCEKMHCQRSQCLCHFKHMPATIIVLVIMQDSNMAELHNTQTRHDNRILLRLSGSCSCWLVVLSCVL